MAFWRFWTFQTEKPRYQAVRTTSLRRTKGNRARPCGRASGGFQFADRSTPNAPKSKCVPGRHHVLKRFHSNSLKGLKNRPRVFRRFPDANTNYNRGVGRLRASYSSILFTGNSFLIAIPSKKCFSRFKKAFKLLFNRFAAKGSSPNPICAMAWPWSKNPWSKQT